MRNRARYLYLIIGLAILLAGCNLPVLARGTYVWIDAPVTDIQLEVSQEIKIKGHASSNAGVTKVEIWVNDELESECEDLPARGNLAEFEHGWAPPEPGEYHIQVVAFGGDDTTSEPDSVVVNVLGKVAMVTTPGTVTVTQTGEMAPVTTGTTTLTATPPWAGKPTRTPTLAEHPLTRTLTEIPDTQAPPAPSGLSPTGGEMLACTGKVTLSWGAVSDPSGIGEYRVKVERSSDGSTWKAHSNSPWSGLSGTSVNIAVECGWYYRWRTRAVDGAGNEGTFSGWAIFAVSFG